MRGNCATEIISILLFFLFSAVEIRELQGACQIWALVDTIMIQLVIKHFWNLIKVLGLLQTSNVSCTLINKCEAVDLSHQSH